MTRREWRLAASAGIAIIPVAAFLAWSIWTRDIQVELGEDLCPVDPGSSVEHSIVLLDVSEALTGGNAKELKRQIVSVGDNLQRYGKLAVFDIHDVSTPIVSTCRPQKLGECDPKTAPRACRGVQEAYKRDFAEPVAAKIDKFLARQSDRPSSPIMEAIKDVSTLSAFNRMSTGMKNLYIVSDMLQNTPGVYSHYDHSVQASEFAMVSREQFYIDHQPDLEGANVEILYILRRKYRSLQTNHHKSFWQEYFQDTNAQRVRLEEMNFVGGDTSAGQSNYVNVMDSGRVSKGIVRPTVSGNPLALTEGHLSNAHSPVLPNTEVPFPQPDNATVAKRAAVDDTSGIPDLDDTLEDTDAGNVSVVPPSPPMEVTPEFDPRPGTAFADSLMSGGIGPAMVVLPPGKFRMGCVSARECTRNEMPAHEARIPHLFAMSQYEVTMADFGRFIETSGYRTQAEVNVTKGCRVLRVGRTRTEWSWTRERHWRKPGYGVNRTHPVTCVSWWDASAYARWLKEQTGRPYRLPTETEWEYAARAGSETSFHFGNNMDQLCRYGNVVDTTKLPGKNTWGNTVNCKDGVVYAARVGSYTANSFRLYDMHGNVAEWVEDCWHPGYDGKVADGSARLASDCAKRVVRGGFWGGPAASVRSAARAGLSTAYRSGGLGIRIVRSLGPQAADLLNDSVQSPITQNTALANDGLIGMNAQNETP